MKIGHTCRTALALWAFTVAVTQSHAAEPFADSTALSDTELNTQRGTFRTPDGLEIALAVQMDTRIAGALVLRSVFTTTSPQALRLFSQAPNSVLKQKETTKSMEPVPGIPVSFAFDRTGGLQTVPTNTTAVPDSQVPVRISVNQPSAPVIEEANLVQIEPNAAGAATSPYGAVSVQTGASDVVVDLVTDTALVRHVLGNTVSNIVANTSNNVVIDTATTVNLSMSGTLPLAVGNSLQHLNNIALPLGLRTAY